MKALFSFEPSKDQDIPSKEAGLAFENGDILEILDQADATWWQVRLRALSWWRKEFVIS